MDDDPIKTVFAVMTGIAAVLTAVVELGKAAGELMKNIDN